MAASRGHKTRAGVVSMSIDLGELQKIAYEMSGSELVAKASEAMDETLAAVAREASRLAAKDTGKMAAGIKYHVWGSAARVWGKVWSPEKYARDIEYGVKPHTRSPKKGELVGWMKRKHYRGTESRLRWKIWEKGSPAQPFMRPALAANRRMLIEALAEKLNTRKIRGTRGRVS